MLTNKTANPTSVTNDTTSLTSITNNDLAGVGYTWNQTPQSWDNADYSWDNIQQQFRPTFTQLTNKTL